jgi:hypothetical protein
MFDLQDPSSRAVVPMADGALGPTPAPEAALPWHVKAVNVAVLRGGQFAWTEAS